MAEPAAAERRTLVTGSSGFIGGHLVERLSRSGRRVLGVCRNPTPQAEQEGTAARADVLDAARLREVVRTFEPTEVVHLAARTDFVERDDAEGWSVNTEGTRNLIAAVSTLARPARCVFASSYVVALPDRRGPVEGSAGRRYGDSKLELERIVREESRLPGSWCVVRPCATWGPRFAAPFREFFVAVARARYFHPGRVDPPKRLGYVENVAHQVTCLLDAPADEVHGQTLYAADYEALTLRAWASRIAVRAGVRAPRTLPELAVGLAARCGDALASLGLARPPLTSVRLRNMRRDTSAGFALEPIRRIAGPAPFTLDQGIDRTLAWLRESGRL